MAPKGKNELERFTEKFGENKIWSTLEERIDDYARDFDIDTDVALYDIDIKFTHNLSVNGSCFEFDVIYDVYVSYMDEYRDEKTKSQWFTVHCAAEVDDVLKYFDVVSVEPYRKTTKSGNATENFVPLISKNQMDIEAESFLRVHCIKALIEPTQVPIRDIVAEIGLKLELGYMLSENFSFFGQISFSDTKIKVFEVESAKTHDLDVCRGTILIDPEVFWERSAGCENFTIAHEVVHWEKHKLFADIKRLLYKNTYVAHRCPKPRNILWESNDDWSDEEWIEWQANGIGARILMPKETLPIKIAEITAGFSDDLKSDKSEYYITLIDELAKFYGTSRLTAKYRLKDMGYMDVENIQIHEYDFQAYTHEIDEYKAFYELCENAELRMLTSTGFFTYADNHFVFNHEKCVMFGLDGIPHLTDFAWANLVKYTLKFRNTRINIKESGNKFSDILYRGKTYETFQKYYSEDNSPAFVEARKLAEQVNADLPKYVNDRTMFCDSVQQYFENKEIKVADFQALTLLSRDTFYKLNKQDYKPSFETVIALCAGLDLDILDSQELLRKAGHAFDGSGRHNAYMMAITHFRGQSILVRNEFLRNLNIEGVKPLGEKDAD